MFVLANAEMNFLNAPVTPLVLVFLHKHARASRGLAAYVL